MIFCKGERSRTRPYYKREFAKKRVNIGALAGFVLFLVGIGDRAKELKANAVFYGHTHTADISEIDGITVINPGSAERFSTNKSFCYCVVANGKITAVINKNIG